MHLRTAITLLLLVAPFLTRGDHRVLLNKTYAERYRLLDSLYYHNKLLNQDSNGFFKELAVMSRAALEDGDKELELEAALLKSSYYLKGQQKNLRLVAPAMNAVILLAQKEGSKEIELRARQFLGLYYMQHTMSYNDALNQFLKSYYLLQQLSLEEFPDKKKHLYNIACAYYQFGDYVQARKYLSEAEHLPSAGYGATQTINLINTIGLIHRKQNQLDSAEYYFRQSFQLAKEHSDTLWMGIAGGNLGITYYKQKRYAEAIPLLENDVQISFQKGELDNGLNSLIKLTDIRLRQNELLNAREGLKLAERRIPEAQDPFYHLQFYYPVLSQYHAKTGDMNAAYLYADSAAFVKDSMYRRLDVMRLARTQHEIDTERYKASLRTMEAEKTVQVIIRNGLILVLCLLAFFAMRRINQARRKYLQQQAALEAENKINHLARLQAETELLSAREQLAQFTQSIQAKNKQIESIRQEIENDSLARSSSVHNAEVLVQLQQSIILTDEQWEKFRQLFEKVHVGYLPRLKKKMPELSPAETRFMALSKLKLSNKEMAGMLGISTDAIRMYRYRLRKKLKISEDAHLTELVESI